MVHEGALIPDDFAGPILASRGALAVEWVEALPEIVARCARRWRLQVGPPFTLSFNYAAPATLPDGKSVVLKICFPDREYLTELHATRLFDGRGAARLLDRDEDDAALLLERLLPGDLLESVEDDEEATTIAASVMRQLWHSVPSEAPYPTVAGWASGLRRLRDRYGGGTGPFPQPLVEEAEALFDDLLASSSQQAVLHGDLHQGNILRDGDAWRAIDPKGVVGEPAYETAALLHNPMPRISEFPDLRDVLFRRIDILAQELGFDRDRIRGWGMAQAVLAAWWSIEDGDRLPRHCLRCAEVLSFS